MILELGHTHLEVYNLTRKLVMCCYRLTSMLPLIEKFNLVQQINRAALSVLLNIAEGASRRSFLERRRFFEIARGSLIEIDAAIQVGVDLNYLNETSIEELKPIMNSCFRLLSKMISTPTK